MAKVTAADVKLARVTIELDGEKVELRPTPDAIIALSARYDGIQPLLAALGRGNIQAAADVVIAGLSLEGKEAKEALRKVASTGLSDLVGPLSNFALIAFNGGRPLKQVDDDDQEKRDPS